MKSALEAARALFRDIRPPGAVLAGVAACPVPSSTTALQRRQWSAVVLWVGRLVAATECEGEDRAIARAFARAAADRILSRAKPGAEKSVKST